MKTQNYLKNVARVGRIERLFRDQSALRNRLQPRHITPTNAYRFGYVPSSLTDAPPFYICDNKNE
jgi:hypothetical protein